MRRTILWCLLLALCGACDDDSTSGGDDTLTPQDTGTSEDTASVDASDTAAEDTEPTDAADTADGAEDTTSSDTTATDTDTAEDTTAGDTTAGDTTAGDTTAGDTTAGDSVEDTSGDVAADVILPNCPRHRLVSLPASEIALVGPTEQALHGEKSFRVAVRYARAACYKRATPEVSIDTASRTVSVNIRAFQSLAEQCDRITTDARWITLSLNDGGAWTVEDVNSDVALTLDVTPPNDGPCGSPTNCAKDCACSGAGEVCLTGEGQAGLFSRCAVPCEENLDCAGRCISIDDGLDKICDTSLSQCDGSAPCPQGYRCDAGGCLATAKLDQSTRIGCECDADCGAPLRCIESEIPGELPRCELRCPTSGGWCAGTGAHVCGDADEDLSGLAGSDSICVWLGE